MNKEVGLPPILESILNGLQPICVIGLDKRYIFNNAAFIRIFGEICENKPGAACCSELQRGPFCRTEFCPLKRIGNGNNWKETLRYTAIDEFEGHRWSMSVEPLEDRQGKLAGIIESYEDLSHQKELEDELEYNKAIFNGLFENSNSGIAIYRPVENGSDFKFVDLNKRGELSEGVKKAEVIGKKVTEIFPKVREFGLLEVFQRVNETGKPEVLPVSFYEDERISGWRENRVFKVPSGHIVTIFADITKQKQVESDLVDSERKHRILFETMAQGVIYMDGDGNFIDANPAAERIVGLSRDQLLGKSPMDPRWHAIHADGSDFPGETHPIVVAMKTGKEVLNVTQGVFIPEENSYRWIVVNAIPQFKPGAKKPYQVYVTFNDITDRKLAEERLEKVNKELEEALEEIDSFSHTVAHDLKSPLHTIRGFLEIIHEESDSANDEFFQRVFSIIEQMRSLIDDILNLSKASKMEVFKTEINLSRIVKEIVTFKLENETDNIPEVSIQPDIMLSADHGLMKVAMENLISNAFKYSSEVDKPCITLGCQEKKGRQVVYIRDNGIGFDPGESDKLFKPFSRLSNSTGHKGTGIGLATVRRILERHGGKIWAESEPGKGSTFYFTLNENTGE